MNDNRYQWTHKDLLDISQLSREDVLHILDVAASFQEINQRPVKKVPTLKGKTVILFFVENSTRTKTSFDVAGKRLSADTYSLAKSGSSLNKGESLKDTALTLQAMSPDVIVIRHPSSGAARFLAERLPCGIVNGGDGWHAHPTQALLDSLTLRAHWGDRLQRTRGDHPRRHRPQPRGPLQRASPEPAGRARPPLRPAHPAAPRASTTGLPRSSPIRMPPCATATPSCAFASSSNASRPGCCRI